MGSTTLASGHGFVSCAGCHRCNDEISVDRDYTSGVMQAKMCGKAIIAERSCKHNVCQPQSSSCSGHHVYRLLSQGQTADEHYSAVQWSLSIAFARTSYPVRGTEATSCHHSHTPGVTYLSRGAKTRGPSGQTRTADRGAEKAHC